MRTRSFVSALVLSLALCHPIRAGSPLLLGVGKPPVAASGYTGPGDTLSYLVWGGLRAYSAATRGTKAINVCNVSDVVCADLSTDATTGALVVSTVGGSNCAIVTCTVKTVYNQPNPGVNDCTQATIANRPTLIATGGPTSASAALGFARASSQTMDCGTETTGTQPFVYSAVVERTGTTGSFNTVIGSGGPDMLFNSSANGCGIYANTVFVDTTHCADSAWHAVQGLFNNASSQIYIDGNSTVGTAGVAVSTANYVLGNGIGGLLDGRLVEFGIVSGNQSGTFSAINSNQHAFWGF